MKIFPNGLNSSGLKYFDMMRRVGLFLRSNSLFYRDPIIYFL